MAEEEPSDPSLDSSQSPVAESKVEDMPPALDSDADDRSSDQEAGGEDTEDLLDALEEVKGKPCKVTELEVTGFQRTKPDVVARELEGVRNATTLEEIKEELLEALVAFQELDVFSEVTVDVEKPKEDTPEACRVALFLEEKDIHFLKGTTFVQSDEGGLDGHVGIRNFFGRAERFKLSCEWGSRKSSEYALEFCKPRIKGLPMTLDVRLFNNHRSSLPYSSYIEQMRGASIGVTSSGGMHRLAYEFGWQHLTDPTNLASCPVREQLGHKLRSKLSYNLMINHLTPFGDRPESGFACRWLSEVGGLHPHAQVLKFIKHRADVEIAVPILTWMSASLGLTAGAMLPVGEGYRDRTTGINDRFSLGGIGSLRGFYQRGCGPTTICRPAPDGGIQRRDALGGDFLWSTKASVNFDIPISGMKAAGIYGHAFGNIGNMVLLTGLGRSLKQSWNEAVMNPKVSAGIGLVWPLGNWGTLEYLPLWEELVYRIDQGSPGKNKYRPPVTMNLSIKHFPDENHPKP